MKASNFYQSLPSKTTKKTYNFLHIGLVQVEIRPLSKEGLDTSFMLALKRQKIP